MKNYQPKRTGHKRENTPCVRKDLRTPGARRGSSGCHHCGECCHDGFATYVHVSKQRVNIYTLTFKIDLKYGGEDQTEVQINCSKANELPNTSTDWRHLIKCHINRSSLLPKHPHSKLQLERMKQIYQEIVFKL
jgi:hypothetical protein